ncbi:VOC family protein [Georgenia subflava]|uniref:VOC family protein n=1 Tax=Georgenia subflava TaxID=1622177 RepID=A0A6N7EPN3_9MICO|nr:VOC family protein [Georgenia subflava]MPV39078.1 VOC family protein [Georgenia subflava]
MSDEARTDVVAWFDIPVTDLDRATAFYGAILQAELTRYSAPGIEGALFPTTGLSGTLLKGEGFVPSHAGSVVYLDGGDDLSTVLDRVEAAGGTVLLPKREIGGGRGYFAYFQDTEGNRIGLHSAG